MSRMATKKSAAPVKKSAAAARPAKTPVKKAAASAKKVAAAKPAAKTTPKPVAKPAAVKAVAKAKPAVKAPSASKNQKVVAKAPAKAQPVAAAKPVKKETAPVKAAPSAKKTEKVAAKPEKKVVAKRAKDITITPAKQVTMPKINTTTSRKYQPEFLRSVLDDSPKHDMGAPITRYSDADLLEFRELIQRKLDAAKKELNYLQGLITRKDELGGDESDNRYMTMEDGSLSMEREQLSQMASRQITFVDHLEKATMRIENKTYGICRVTGKLIDKARLRAVPHATLSIEAKKGMAK